MFLAAPVLLTQFSKAGPRVSLGFPRSLCPSWAQRTCTAGICFPLDPPLWCLLSPIWLWTWTVLDSEGIMWYFVYLYNVILNTAAVVFFFTNNAQHLPLFHPFRSMQCLLNCPHHWFSLSIFFSPHSQFDTPKRRKHPPLEKVSSFASDVSSDAGEPPWKAIVPAYWCC